MRKITLLFAFLLMLSTTTSAATGWFSDYVKLNVNGAGESFYWIGSDPSYGTQLQGAALGSVSSLEITGCDMKYWSDSQDRTGGAFYYKVTNTAGTVDYIASTEVIWDQTYLSGNDYQGLKSTSINLLAGLPYGTRDYKLQVWSKSWGSNQGDIYLSNDGANYVATFSYTKTNPTTFSGTYKVGESTGTNFTSLSAAVSAINAGTISGNVLLEITSNITENASIGLTATTGSNTITIKPASSVNPIITFSGCSTATGATQYSGFALNNTSNVIIDGSNTVSGITKDMSFKMNDATNGRNIIQLYGNCDNVTIMNLKITFVAPMSIANSSRGVYLNGQSTGACDNFNIQNCSIGDATNTPYYGVGVTGYGTAPTIYCTNVIVRNNYIYGRIRPVYLYYVGTSSTTSEISENTIYTYGGANATTTYSIMWNTWAGTLNIFNNRIPVLSVANTSGTSGVYGVSGLTAATNSIVNFKNNFVGGSIASTGASVPAVFSLMYIQDAATYNIYNNTFYYNNLTNATEKSNIHISGTGCVVNLKNNLIINNTDNSTAYCIWKSNGTLTSNYNNLYVSGSTANIGYLTSARKTLANWQAAFTPNNDLNSISKNVSFVSATDLSLTGTSINDVSLGVPRLATVLTDILGTNRGATTYMGAHEVGAIVATDLNATDITIANNGNVAVTKKGHLTFDDDKTINTLSIEGGGKVTLADTKSLTVTNFTIKSIADSTGTFVNRNETGGLAISGSKSVQQYLASSRNWYMSSPINDAKALSGYTYYQYNEPNGSLGTNWTSLNVGDDLTVGKGYIIKPTATDTYNFSTNDGELNDGNIPVTIYRTDGVSKAGFNLVGNPYPSYINVDNLVNSSVEASYWVRTRNAAQTGWTFDTYNIPSALSTGGSGKSVTKMISPMQAFWLRVKSPATQATLTFTNGLRDHKDDLNNNFRAPAVNNQSVLRLSVSDGTNNDETLVYFNAKASNDVDAYDSHKMLNGETSLSPDIYTLAGIEQLAINGMSTIPAEIPLYIKPNASTSGQFSLRATEVSNFEAGTQVYIKNGKTGEQQLVSDGSVYSFDITADPLLSIIIKAPGAVTGLDNPTSTFNVYANAKGQLTVVVPAVNDGDVARVYNSAGQCLLNQSLTNSRTMLNKFFTAGVYVVKVNETIRKVVIE